MGGCREGAIRPILKEEWVGGCGGGGWGVIFQKKEILFNIIFENCDFT